MPSCTTANASLNPTFRRLAAALVQGIVTPVSANEGADLQVLGNNPFRT
jgi:hypothetical protein